MSPSRDVQLNETMTRYTRNNSLSTKRLPMNSEFDAMIKFSLWTFDTRITLPYMICYIILNIKLSLVKDSINFEAVGIPLPWYIL
jgi:hypothetical protein